MSSELLLLFGIFNIFLFSLGLLNTTKGNVFKETPYFFWLGIFVWGDSLVIAPFWFAVSVISLIIQSQYFFFFVVSIFWVIRSLGETIYWLNQQFSSKLRNPPERLMLYSLIKSDAIWFIYQVFWQCMFVLAVIGAVYFGRLWLLSL